MIRRDIGRPSPPSVAIAPFTRPRKAGELIEQMSAARAAAE
jgi:hypothetical protein